MSMQANDNSARNGRTAGADPLDPLSYDRLALAGSEPER